MNEMLLKNIDSFIKDNEEALFRDIARIVAVDSVRGEAAPEAPYGEGPRKALDTALQIAREMGLETRDLDHKIGYAVAGEDGDSYLATITHLDVVGIGEGWTTDPFKMEERDGYILGRGVMDDKGPSILCLYALKYLKESGAKLKYPVRALLGTDEEVGMSDVEYYLENYPAPLFLFSPDADFPLIHGEKGIYGAKLVSRHITDGSIVAIKGGFASNAIPDKASAVLRVPAEKASVMRNTEWVNVLQTAEDLWMLTARGKAGHASQPAGKVNAIGKLIDYILEKDLASRKETAYLKLIAKIHAAYDGSAVGIAAADGRFTPLTVVNGMIWQEADQIYATVDSRFTTDTSGEKISEQLIAAAAGAATLKDAHATEPFYMDPTSPEIRACVDAYKEVTGDEAEPFTIGGGTYARHFPNGAAFGPEHPGRTYPDFVGGIHGANEGASKAELLEALKIYILALLKLEELTF